MADRDAIADLFANYAYANDIANADLMEDMFVADARFSLTIAGQQAAGPFEDRDTQLDFFREALGAQSAEQRRHATTNFRYTAETDDSADVEAYLVLTSTENGAARLVCTGVYQTTIKREGDAWRFSDMTIALDSGF